MVRVESWMRVKQGFVVPVTVQSAPQVDFELGLRMFSAIRERYQFEFEDLTMDYSQVFVFLINGYGAIDSVSRESQEYLKISSKMLD